MLGGLLSMAFGYTSSAAEVQAAHQLTAPSQLNSASATCGVGDWMVGTATYYDGEHTGACGGAEFGGYGIGESWIDGYYAAPASHNMCSGASGSEECGSHHGWMCGQCLEVECVGSDANTHACTGARASCATRAGTEGSNVINIE